MQSTAVTVLAFFTTSEAYKADVNVIKEGMALISSCDGVLENHHGISMENNDVGITIQVATSAEAFQAVLSNQELFDDIFNKMQVGRIGGIDHFHTNPISDPKKALSGPVTEVYCMSLDSGLPQLHGPFPPFRIYVVASLKNPTPENKEAFETIAGSFGNITDGKWTYGWCFEDPNKAIILASWDSIEAQQAFELESDVANSLNVFKSLIDTNGGPFHFNLVQI